MKTSFAVICFLSLFFTSATVFGGQKIFVPMSWCIVAGSPAANSPPNFIGADNQTDAIIWRRHERPTDTIYTPQANMSLRSAINNAWGSFNFPIINDPDPTGGGQISDIRGEDVNINGAEFFAIMNDCDAQYAALGRAGVGITAVNVGLYHDAGDNYVNTIGWGGCSEAPAGTCVVPFNGLIGVIDNRYLHPSSPDRTRPDGGTYATLDPRDVLTGHEVGHALSLDHFSDVTRMMNPFITGSNFGLTAAEITALRANAMNVPGVEIDPPGVFNPGKWRATRIPDEIDGLGQKERPGFLDIASANMAFNKETGELHAEILMREKLPLRLPEPPCEWIFLVNTDNNGGTGLDSSVLREFGVPINRADYKGADLLLHATFESGPAGPILVHTAIAMNDKVTDVTEAFRPEIRDLAVYRALAGPSDELNDRAVLAQSIAWVANPHLPDFDMLPHLPDPIKPMQIPIQVIVTQGGEEQDVLDPRNLGIDLVLEDPTFPHCFPPETAVAGETIQVPADGFPPGAEVHAFLGDELVGNIMKTDDAGNITFPIPIPKDAAGERLITIGVLDTALTADCTVNVKGECDRADIDGDGFVTRRDIAILGQDFRNLQCQ